MFQRSRSRADMAAHELSLVLEPHATSKVFLKYPEDLKAPPKPAVIRVHRDLLASLKGVAGNLSFNQSDMKAAYDKVLERQSYFGLE
eukprot:14579899-Alexandrium_andersonii.AAC.1